MSEPVSLNRNIERLAGLWPSAGFSHDWMDLFRREFRHANQHWLADAIESVKRSKASHVPELKWFIEEFREVGKRFSAPPDAPKTPQERAEADARRRARDEAEVEAGRRADRQAIERSDPAAIDAAFDRLAATPLRGLAKHRGKPLDEWSDLARGMVAAAIRERINTAAPTFGTASH